MTEQSLFTRTTPDLWRAFETQRQALEVSAIAFDAGMKGEAARLANAAFLLVGRGMKTHVSILDQLKIQDQIKFYSSVPDNSLSGGPLMHLEIEQIKKDHYAIGLTPLGTLAARKRSIPFGEWWNEFVMQAGESKTHLSRRQLVRILRDKDGGAHFSDIVKDPLVGSALRGEFTGFLIKNSDGDAKPLPYGLETTMRQIAEELRLTIRHLPTRFMSSEPTAIE